MEIYDLGALIRGLRKQRNMTQKYLANLLDVTEATVCKYENNTSIPPFETMRSIASVFNVSMDTLCGMKHQGTISTHGLSETQVQTLKILADSYRLKNSQAGKPFTQEQYTILGKIVAELLK